jgi:hypothetical protein
MLLRMYSDDVVRFLSAASSTARHSIAWHRIRMEWEKRDDLWRVFEAPVSALLSVLPRKAIAPKGAFVLLFRRR